MARYDIEKRQAIEEEDYEKAKLKKQQMQEYRAETYRQLQLNNLLDFIDVSLVFFAHKKNSFYSFFSKHLKKNKTIAVRSLLKKSNQVLVDNKTDYSSDSYDNKSYKEVINGLFLIVMLYH